MEGNYCSVYVCVVSWKRLIIHILVCYWCVHWILHDHIITSLVVFLQCVSLSFFQSATSETHIGTVKS